MEYWYPGYKTLNLNLDLEKDPEDPTQESDNFYDDTYDDDHDSAFSFWIKIVLDDLFSWQFKM